jgi:6-phosphogluconolactonase
VLIAKKCSNWCKNKTLAMQKFVILAMLVALVISGSAQTNLSEKIYVGTFTSEDAEGIYLCDFDISSGEISLVSTFKGIDNPSFLKISPDKQYLFAVTRPPAGIEASGGYVNAYRIEKNGNLRFINKQISNGEDPCHVDVSPDGKFVAIATYGGGTTSLYRVSDSGSLKPASSVIYNKGSGPTPRQRAPHAHSIKFSKDGKQAFSADLGTDQLNIYGVKKGKLIPYRQNYVKLAPGAGPRHFSFHPRTNVIYVINELNSTVSVLEKKGKSREVIQTVSTVPEGFTEDNYCADIHISADGKYVYGSNRGHNSIAVFTADPMSQKLELITTIPTRGDWPRNFTLSPDGRFLLVANQRSNNIVVFKINPENGIPEFTGNVLQVPAPVCLEFI